MPPFDTDYAVNRQYSQSVGRFMRTDPYNGSSSLSNPRSFNRYAYAQNDPINATDPLGLCLCAQNYVEDDGHGNELRWVECFLCREGNIKGIGGGGGGDTRGGGGTPEDSGCGKAVKKVRDYAASLATNSSMSDCEKLARIAYNAGQAVSQANTDASVDQEALAQPIVDVLRMVLTDLGVLGQGNNSANCRVGVFTRDPNYGGGFKDAGFRPPYQDSTPGSQNQVRHFTGWFYAGHAVGNNSVTQNQLFQQEGTSDPRDPDVALGLVALQMGVNFNGDYRQLAQDIWHNICGQSGDLSLP